METEFCPCQGPPTGLGFGSQPLLTMEDLHTVVTGAQLGPEITGTATDMCLCVYNDLHPVY